MNLELALNFLVILRDMCNRDSIKRLTLDLKFQLEYLTWVRFQVTTWYLILFNYQPESVTRIQILAESICCRGRSASRLFTVCPRWPRLRVSNHWHFKLASLARRNCTVTTSSIQARFRAKRSSIATQGRSRAHIHIRVRPAIDRSDPFSEQSVKTCNNSTPVVRYVTKLVQN